MWVAEQDWNVESLAMLLATLLHDHERLRDQSQVLRQMARPNAARDIACLCEELLRQI
jgi:UDP-N-acetylglucosamine:LPS N-acetylglucosamine transferase